MSKPVTGRTRDLVILLDKLIYGLTKHWLLAVNLAIALYIALPLLAPWLMANGQERVANWVYRLYGPPACHQLAERSYFLYGPQYEYSAQELEERAGPGLPPRYTGDEDIGFKMGICQRCVAIYFTLLLSGLAFGLVREQLRPIHWRYLLVFWAPLFVDGTGQLVGLWESSWLTRTVTGILASAGLVLFVYPLVEEAMRGVRATITDQLGLDSGGQGSGTLGGKEERPQAKEPQDHQGEELVEPGG